MNQKKVNRHEYERIGTNQNEGKKSLYKKSPTVSPLHHTPTKPPSVKRKGRLAAACRISDISHRVSATPQVPLMRVRYDARHGTCQNVSKVSSLCYLVRQTDSWLAEMSSKGRGRGDMHASALDLSRDGCVRASFGLSLCHEETFR